MAAVHEIRDPVHGFVTFEDDLEWDIVNHDWFQRLRRIRQLGLTDMLYPGALHTRFEHSIGVMHVATRMYDAVTTKCAELLAREMQVNKEGLGRQRKIVRLAALLHDIGHCPLSHGAEDLMPVAPDGAKVKHEDYSAAIIRSELAQVIETNQVNQQNYGITAAEVADQLETEPEAKQLVKDNRG